MPNIDPRTGAQLLQRLLQPWHEAVKDPPKAQQEVLQYKSIPDRVNAFTLSPVSC